MTPTLLACPHCDLLQREVALGRGTLARCARCHFVLDRPYDENVDRPLAFTLAAAVLFILANAFPIVGLEIANQHTTATLISTAWALYEQQHMKFLGALVFFTTVLVPTIQLSAMTYVLLLLKFDRTPRFLPHALRALQAVRPWGMVEVFLLGLLVSLVKLAGMAEVMPGPGLWAFGGLLMMIAAAVATFDARAAWSYQRLAR